MTTNLSKPRKLKSFELLRIHGRISKTRHSIIFKQIELSNYEDIEYMINHWKSNNKRCDKYGESDCMRCFLRNKSINCGDILYIRDFPLQLFDDILTYKRIIDEFK